jgi:hypothetical protein
MGWRSFQKKRGGQCVGSIYLIWDGGAYVKLGWTSCTPQSRIAELQCGNPHTLVLLGTKRGKLSDELALHKAWNRCRFRSEWFAPDHEMWSALSETFSFDMAKVCDESM